MKTRGRFHNWWYWAAAVALVAVLEFATELAGANNSPFGDRTPAAFGRIGLALLVVGVAAVTAAAVLWTTRYAGMNEVYGTNATDAATPHAEQSGLHQPTRYVSDRQLASLATTAFVPPVGIAPWQGHALLRDEVNRRTSDSFVASLIADDALRIDESAPGRPQLVPGPQLNNVDEFERGWIARLLGADGVVTLYQFDADYASGMEELTPALRERLLLTGWWRDGLGPTLVTSNVTAADSRGRIATMVKIGVLSIVPLVLFTLPVPSPFWLAVWTMIVSAIATIVILVPSWPSRTAEGSAYALQTESFRRFLEGSESARVEHAWGLGTVREYGAWAIAIDNADAWRPEIALAQTSRQSGYSVSYRLPSIRAAMTRPRSSRSLAGRRETGLRLR